MEVAEHRFFELFDAPVAERLAGLCERMVLPAGEFLFHENAPPDAFYLVLEGRIELVKELAGDRLEPLAWVDPNDYFGELGVLDGSGRSTAARAEHDTLLGRIPGTEFLDVMREAPGRAALGLFDKIIDNMRTTNDRFMAHKLSQEKMALVGEMAGSIVHDLRGPYGGIKLAIEMIEEEHADNSETRELCGAVREQVRRSLGMLDDLLQFSRGVPELRREPHGLSELIAGFGRLNASFLAQSGVSLRLELEDAPVQVDPDKILRVLQNLTNNAVEAFGGGGGSIEISGGPEGDAVVLRVRDDGPGIPEPIRDRVFDAFVTYGKASGTGLGTAIARSIVEAHGGTISVETTTRKGTTFSIRLPKDIE